MYNDFWNKYMEKKSEEAPKEDLLVMMHIAVNTGDREWFYELAKRIERAV